MQWTIRDNGFLEKSSLMEWWGKYCLDLVCKWVEGTKWAHRYQCSPKAVLMWQFSLGPTAFIGVELCRALQTTTPVRLSRVPDDLSAGGALLAEGRALCIDIQDPYLHCTLEWEMFVPQNDIKALKTYTTLLTLPSHTHARVHTQGCRRIHLPMLIFTECNDSNILCE